MSGDGDTGAHSGESIAGSREFNDDELGLMLYEWEEDAGSVVEYHCRSEKGAPGANETAAVGSEGDATKADEGAEKGKSLKNDAKDTGNRSEIDLGKGSDGAKPVFLELDTSETAFVVEFYAPWCPHCQNYKWDYIEIAAEATRRSIATPIKFFAVSCEMYRDLCRTYHIKGFPTILGFGVGSSVHERGIELNPVGKPEMTADTIGKALDIGLAHEARSFDTSSYSNSADEKKHNERIAKAAAKAANLKTSWHEFQPNTLNDRYHNAALSLAFALKSGVYVHHGSLDARRSSALKDFLDLLDWATPQSWNVRTGLVKELRLEFDDAVVKGRDKLEEIVDRNFMPPHSGDALWGYIETTPPQRRKSKGTPVGSTAKNLSATAENRGDTYTLSRKWTQSCTHSKPAMGFTCGLWELFHIVSIGSSRREHQLYGFHNGYVVSSRYVAATIRNFVAYFFNCDVCRWNFIDHYDSCGHEVCRRLSLDISNIQGSTAAHKIALWLWEVHNSVNVRLMREGAERQNRDVSREERIAGLFPTKKMCQDCWLDTNMTAWDNDAVLTFLSTWYWPSDEQPNDQFNSVVGRAVHSFRRVDAQLLSEKEEEEVRSNAPFTKMPLAVGILVLFLVGVCSRRIASHQKGRKKFIDSRFSSHKRTGYMTDMC